VVFEKGDVDGSSADTYYLLGILLRFLVREPDAGYCLVEGLAAPPPNRHPADDEAFYVIDGEFEFLVGERKIVAGPGDFVKVRKGEVHAFKNIGNAPPGSRS
jgi:mannose-6-phosphate isomerase-like protein (cupin superfamily)